MLTESSVMFFSPSRAVSAILRDEYLTSAVTNPRLWRTYLMRNASKHVHTRKWTEEGPSVSRIKVAGWGFSGTIAAKFEH